MFIVVLLHLVVDVLEYVVIKEVRVRSHLFILLCVEYEEASKEHRTPSKDEEKVGIIVCHVSKLQIMMIGRTHSAICNRADTMHSVSAKTCQILLMIIIVLLQG